MIKLQSNHNIKALLFQKFIYTLSNNYSMVSKNTTIKKITDKIVSNFFILQSQQHYQFSYTIYFDKLRYRLKPKWQCPQKHKQ